MRKHRLNEDRGARRAEALKSRFKRVTDRSLGGRGRSVGASIGSRQTKGGRLVSRNGIAVWLVIGLVAYLVGTVLT